MAVTFEAIPGNLLVPLFYAEINSGGSPYLNQARLLLLVQKLAGGTATADRVVGPVQSEREVAALCGVGSMAVESYAMARRAAPFQPIWLGVLADPAGAAASGTITVNSAPGTNAVGVVEVAGKRLTFLILAADSASAIATSIAAAVNAAGLIVTAAAVGAVVTITSRHVGVIGNEIEIAVPTNEPNGLAGRVTLSGAYLADGTGVPALTNLLAALGDDEFDWIVGPYHDATSLTAMRDLLSDASGRWSPSKMLYGHYATARADTLSTLVTFANGRNDRHASLLGLRPAPTPAWLTAAALGGKLAQHLANPPELSRPLHTIELEGVRPPRDRGDWWDIDDRQALLASGLSCTQVTFDGRTQISKIVGLEKTDAHGVPDRTFSPINTLAQAMFISRWFRARVVQEHGRNALADDNPANIAGLSTPASIRSTLTHAYQELVTLGVAEKPALFAQALVVERDPVNANRINAYLPFDVVNQLDVFAANVTLFLEYR